MADQHHLINAQLVQQFFITFCLLGQGLRVNPVGITMPRPVNKDHARLATQGWLKGHHLVIEIAAGAMNEQHIRPFLSGRQLDVDGVSALPFRPDKRSSRLMSVLNRKNLGIGPGKCNRQNRENGNQKEQIDFQISPMSDKNAAPPPILGSMA